MKEESIFLEKAGTFLCKRGFCTERSAKNFIKNNEIFIKNSKDEKSRINDKNFLFDAENDSIYVNGILLPRSKHSYIILNKPKDYVSSTVSDRRKTVYELLPVSEIEEKAFSKLHTIGRLDADSEGMLLLTTNGNLSNFLSRPESQIEKTYYVKLQNDVNEDIQKNYKERFKEGIFLEAFKHGKAFTTLGAKLNFISKTECKVCIKEGKFRQIRRMFSALGNEVIILKRTATGRLKLGENIKSGEFRFLTRDEILTCADDIQYL